MAKLKVQWKGIYLMTKILRNKNGLTLIELLAAVTLTSLIFIFAGSFLIKGINHYNEISNEIALRDEADIIMSNLVRTLYTTKETNITSIKFPNNNTTNYYFEIKTPNGSKKTGFINNKLVIQDSIYQISNSAIVLSKDSTIIKNEQGIYTVKLKLNIPSKGKQMIFENEIRTINDKAKEENS